MAAGLPAGIDRFHQDGVHPQAVPRQHVGEDPVSHHRHLGGGKIELLQHPLQQLDLPAAQVAMVGDRVFTDVLAGNRLGMYTVLVKPIDPSGQPCRHDHWQRFEVKLAQLAGADLP